MCLIYIIHLEKNEPGMNTILSEYMIYNGPSLEKWVRGRVEQLEKPC